MTNNENDRIQKSEECGSTRRAIAKKAAYVIPTVLAVIAASERPALAQSGIQLPQ